MKAVVTGATGFVGSHLVDQLLEQGFQVRVIVRGSSNLKWLPEDKIEVVRGSLQDPDFMASAVNGCEYVFHVAGTLVAASMEEFRDVNVKPTRLLLEACEKTPGIKRFVLVSSQGASGPSKDGIPLTEESVPNPVSDYGRTKLEAEELTMSFKDRVPVTALRPSAVYGPRDDNFIKLFRNVKRGYMPKFGREERYTNLVHAVDLAKGIILAAQSEKTRGEMYFISNDVSYSNSQLIEGMAEAMGTKVKRFMLPDSVFTLAKLYARLQKKITGKTGLLDEQRIATVEERYWTANVSKLRRDLGWTPPTPMQQGLNETVRWYRENGML